MEALVLGIGNSLIPVEICTCNEIHKYIYIHITVKFSLTQYMSSGIDLHLHSHTVLFFSCEGERRIRKTDNSI